MRSGALRLLPVLAVAALGGCGAPSDAADDAEGFGEPTTEEALTPGPYKNGLDRKVYPSNRDRDLACPVAATSAAGYAPAQARLADVEIDARALRGVVPDGFRVAVILVKRVDGTPRVNGDRIKLTQVLTNLLLNAAQAIPEGDREHNRVEVATGAREQRVFVRVSDTGAGIPKEVQARLFQRFSSGPDRATHNAGLGLYLCRLVAEAHGGSIGLVPDPLWNVVFVARRPAQLGAAGAARLLAPHARAA